MRQRTREPDHAVLRPVYTGVAPCPIKPSIDAMPTIAEPGYASRSAGRNACTSVASAAQVDLEHGVERGGVEQVRGRCHRDAGGVHQSADSAEHSKGGLDAGVDRVGIADVDLERGGGHTELGGALVGDGLGAGAVQVPRRHRATDLGQGAGRPHVRFPTLPR